MFCCKCGTKLADDSRFCYKCGTEVGGYIPSAVSQATAQYGSRATSSPSMYRSNQSQAKIVQLKCQECNGIMRMDSERTVIMCPYCGSKKLIVENDNVKIARIKASAHKEIAEMVLDSSRRSEESTNQYKQIFILCITLVAMMLLGVLLTWITK